MGQRKHTDKANNRNNYFDLGASGLVYLFATVLFVVFPLYTYNGYEAIATNKYRFFMLTALYAGIVFLAYFVVAFVIWGFSKETFKKSKSGYAVLGVTVIYTITNAISFFFSNYKMLPDAVSNKRIEWFVPGAFYGCRSWYMGLATTMAMTLCAVIIGLFLRYEDYILIPVLLGALLVALWGIANRYGKYPVKMEYSLETFVSSMGNLDWYCGYLVLLAPIAWGLYLASNKLFKSILAYILSLVFFFAIIVNGAESGYFAIGITLVVGLSISFKSPKMLGKFAGLGINFSLALILIRLIDIIDPNARNLKEGLSEIIISTPFIALLMAFCLVILAYSLLAVKERVKYPLFLKKYAGKVLMALLVLGIIFLISLVVINTKSPNKLPLIGNSPYFNFDMAWGSDRGACYYIAVETYKQQPFLRKIFGIGPDAFYFAAYDISKIQEISATYLWKLKLTNAHNEILNILVNEGILGLVSFAAMWFMIFKSLLKNVVNNPISIAFILAFTSYLSNNMFSFRQIESTPLLYGLLGMAVALIARASKVDKSGVKD